MANLSTTFFKSGQVNADYLLIINKGPGALYVGKEGDSWDLMEIYFMDSDITVITSGNMNSEADYIVFETNPEMRKFSIVKRLYQINADLWNYKAVMIIDDDLTPHGCSIADIFNKFIETNMRVGQPALSHDSFYSHPITLVDAKFDWRITNFVELMCPIFTKEALSNYIKYFDETVSGFGLDNLWSKKEWEFNGGLAIIDSATMRHNRPVRGGVAYHGISPDDDKFRLFRKFAITPYKNVTLGGMYRTGRFIPNTIKYNITYSDLIKARIKRWVHSLRRLRYELKAKKYG